MSNDMLSQEEIEALLSKNSKKQLGNLNDTEKDIIGEVGNISMSTAATTLSEILNRKVNITTPKVSWERFGNIIEGMESPKLVAEVDFKEGLTGSNIFMVNIDDAAIIADLMMGGDGIVKNSEMSELEQSAVAEAMNQMIGSASTSMATMVGRGVDINPPKVRTWNRSDEFEIEGIDPETQVCMIEFDLTVEGLIESKIMQFFEKETIDEIIASVEGESKKEAEQYEKEKTNKEKQKVEARKVEPSEPVTVQKPIFNDLNSSLGEDRSPRNLDLIMDVPLEFSVVLGKSKKTIKDILSFGSGSVIELNKQADEALEIYVNGKLIAQGEVVVINENFGIRITNILSKEQRVKGL